MQTDATAAALVKAASIATVGGLFHQQVLSTPDRTAIVDGERSCTYAELEDRTDRLAQVFASKDAKPGARVALLARNCMEFLEIELAAAKAGVIVAALNWRLGAREMAHCINLVAPDLILVQDDLQASLSGLDIAPLPRIVIGADYETALSTAPTGAPDLAVDPEAGLVILYTSGTTGMPKGALISHRAFIARAMSFSTELQLDRDESFCAWPPLYHMASTDHSLATLMRGGTVHVIDGYQPDQMIDFLERHHTGLFFLMPGMVRRFIDDWTARGATARGLVVCGAMADLVPAEDIAEVTRLLQAPYLNTFGSTETGLPPASAGRLEIGKPPKNLAKVQSAFCDLRLVDDDDAEVPPGEPGEVAVRGPTLFSGYWNAEETNAKDFRNGWFHMGDVMRRNPDGTLSYVDRKKYMIKSGGENIYPAEIETVILDLPDVSEAVVVRQPDDQWGEVPVAFVVGGDADRVREHCAANLSRYKQPKALFLIESADLPRSTTGKVQRHVLEERLARGGN